MMLDGNQIGQEIVSIVSDVTGFEKEEIKPETDFFKDLEVDSIKAIEIAVAIEKKFKISVRDEEVAKIKTVSHAVEIVDKALRESTTAGKAIENV
jgi:acyl carrier protein